MKRILLLIILVFAICGQVFPQMMIQPYRFAAAGTVNFIDSTGQAAALAVSSQRKLRSAYSGSAFRLRRTSDDAEADIGFTGDLVNYSAATAFCAATTCYLAAWYSQQGSVDLVQETASKQPQIDLTNKRFVLDGANSAIYTNANLDLSGTDKLTIFDVVKFNATDLQIFLEQSTNWNSNNSFIQYADTTFFAGQHSDGYNYKSGTNNTNQNLFSIVFDRALSGNSQTIFRANGAAQTTSNGDNNTGNFAANGVYVGARANSSFYVNGYMKEIVFFPIAFTSGQIASAETNINGFYGIF